MNKRMPGPIEILCKEIGTPFSGKFESEFVLIAFVGVLVGEIEEMISGAAHVQHLTGGRVPSEIRKAREAVTCVKAVLMAQTKEELINAATKAHRTVSVHDEGPCNHYIDMLSSCVSAIRFGLEEPCHSRHAAEAANHIWKRRYGLTLFDSHSSAWSKQWASAKFLEALASACTPDLLAENERLRKTLRAIVRLARYTPNGSHILVTAQQALNNEAP